jgi:ankyrin repeat protein
VQAWQAVEVQDWIASGKSLRLPAELRTTPLKIAIDTGFHSLVEVLARTEPDQNTKNLALRHAVSHQRDEFVDILVSNGAEINSIPFIEVLRAWKPAIIHYFLDHNADFITDSPFAIAFGERIRTTIGPWRECLAKHPKFAPQLQECADRALRHFCLIDDLKWVSLLMWAGADPRSVGPAIDDDPDEEGLSALAAAAQSEDVRIIKRLKPDANIDNVHALLREAAVCGYHQVVQYLFELGARPNDKPNGGSTAFDNCLETFVCRSSISTFSLSGYSTHKATKYDLENTRTTVKLLLEHGALWRPDKARDIACVRRALYECQPDVIFELVQLLIKHAACPHETIHKLLRTPAMKNHLITVARDFLRVGIDVRTKAQKLEDEREQKRHRQWVLEQLAARYNRKKIYKEIWSEPIQHVAKRYNLSDVGLAKVCRKLKIPRPGRGYWAIKAAGKRVPNRPPLPELASRPNRKHRSSVRCAGRDGSFQSALGHTWCR